MAEQERERLARCLNVFLECSGIISVVIVVLRVKLHLPVFVTFFCHMDLSERYEMLLLHFGADRCDS